MRGVLDTSAIEGGDAREKGRIEGLDSPIAMARRRVSRYPLYRDVEEERRQ